MPISGAYKGNGIVFDKSEVREVGGNLNAMFDLVQIQGKGLFTRVIRRFQKSGFHCKIKTVSFCRNNDLVRFKTANK